MKKYYIFLCVILISLFSLPFIYSTTISDNTATHLNVNTDNKTLEISGTIEGKNTLPVNFSYPVYIKECFVENNSYVNKGQLIFTLDTEKMQEAAKQLDLSQYNNNGLKKEDILSIPQNIYASESGTITDLYAYSGAMVLPKENLCSIVTDSSSILKISINQEDYSKISVGDTVEFNTIISPEKTYHGKINNKTAVIRKETAIGGTKTVIDIYADISDADDYIAEGLQVSGKIAIGEERTIYTLPYEFIGQDENGEFVYTLSDGETKKEYIETGVELDNEVEITTKFSTDTLFLKNSGYNSKKVLVKYEN